MIQLIKKSKKLIKQIQEMVRQTSLFDQGSIVFAEGAKQLIFTVDNLSKEDTDFQKIRCALQQTIEKSRSIYCRMSIHLVNL